MESVTLSITSNSQHLHFFGYFNHLVYILIPIFSRDVKCIEVATRKLEWVCVPDVSRVSYSQATRKNIT